MNAFELKYGCNPNQKPARIFMEQGDLPVEVLNGRPGYINFLDAFNSWQLVQELKEATGTVCAASFKHVSPAGTALGLPMSDALKKACFVDDIAGLDSSPLAWAYARARGADRMSSFGDWIALSDPCDAVTASIIKREVSDGIIAPGYDADALEILKSKKRGGYNIVRMDPDYTPAALERKQVYGITFEQGRNDFDINAGLLKNVVTQNKDLPESAVRDLIVAPDHTEVHTVQLGLLRDRRAEHRRSGPASRAASTAPGWPERRRTAGSCARIWSFPSRTAWGVPTGTTPSTCSSRT